MEGPQLRMVHADPALLASSERTDWRGRPLAEVYPEMVAQGVIAIYEQVQRTGAAVHEPEWRVELLDPADGSVVERFLSGSVAPWAVPDGSRSGVVALAHDVSDQVRRRREVERLAAEAGHRYRQVLDVVDELQRALLPADVPVHRSRR